MSAPPRASALPLAAVLAGAGPGLVLPADALDVDGATAPWPMPRGRTSTRRLTATLVGGALASKLLGFVRELIMALILGTSLAADSFRGALTAVLMPLSLMQNESVPIILIPMHRDWQEGGDAPRELAALTAALALAAVALMVAVEALGPAWVDLLVGGFTPEARARTLAFVRVMALAMPASVALNGLSAAEIALGLSRLTTLRAGVLNLSVIAGLGVLAATGRVEALAWSFAAAFNGLALFGIVMLHREGRVAFGGIGPRAVGAAGLAFLRRLRPLLALPVAEQGTVWIERVIASSLAAGTLASLDYARSLTDSASLLVSQPIGLAVLSRGSTFDARAGMERVARPLLACALPASVFLALFAPELARAVFARGAFQDHSVLLSSQALRGIAVGLWASTLGWVLMRMLNGAGRNPAAVLVLTAAYGANAAFNLAAWHLLGPGDAAGPLMLGLGEAARGLVLLCGSALLLGCAPAVLRLVALAALPAGLMAVGGWEIGRAVEGALPRLLVGGAACGLCAALGLALLVPGSRRWASAGLASLSGVRTMGRRR